MTDTNKWAAFTDDELSLLEGWALNYEGAGPLHERLRAEVEAEHVRRGRPAPKPTTGYVVIHAKPGTPEAAVVERMEREWTAALIRDMSTKQPRASKAHRRELLAEITRMSAESPGGYR